MKHLLFFQVSWVASPPSRLSPAAAEPRRDAVGLGLQGCPGGVSRFDYVEWGVVNQLKLNHLQSLYNYINLGLTVVNFRLNPEFVTFEHRGFG